MNEKQRFEYLTKYFHDQLFIDADYAISRTNYSFLLNGYNKYLRLVEENKRLKLQVQMLEMGERVV